MKVLISSPRAGSSYYYEHIEYENLELPNVSKPHPKSEFLNPDIGEWNTHEKIAWLNSERDHGRHYTFKHHINYLTVDGHDYYENWFKDFYHDDEIIVLKRRDTWRWALSFMWQELVNWKTAGVMENYHPAQINTDVDLTKSLDQFFDITQDLERVDGRIVYYEDLDLPWSKFQKLSNIVDYETEMINHGINLTEVKQYYEEKKASTANNSSI